MAPLRSLRIGIAATVAAAVLLPGGVHAAAPPAGVIDLAQVTATYGGPSVQHLPAGVRLVFVQYHFLTRPAASPLTVTWYAPGGHRVFGPYRYVKSEIVVAGLGFRPPYTFSSGNWRVVLRAGAVTAKALAFRVG